MPGCTIPSMLRPAPRVRATPCPPGHETGRRPMTSPAGMLVRTALLLLLLPLRLAAQFDEMKADATLFTRVAGDRVQAALRVVVVPGWHLFHDTKDPQAYEYETRVTLSGEGIVWSRVRFPVPKEFRQPGLDYVSLVHEGTVVLYALGQLAPGATGDDIGATLDGQTCDESCILYEQSVTSQGRGPDELFAAFPADLEADLAVAVAAGAGGAGGAAERAAAGGGRGANDVPASGEGPRLSDAEYQAVEFPPFASREQRAEHGLGVWLLLAFVAGMLLNVMPCVLPVISIKVLSFVQQAGEDRRRVLHLGLAFGAGILVVFLALAALAIQAQLSWGEQFQSQTFLVVMIGIVFALSLSMFGLFELGVPAGIGALAGGRPREGLGDAFFKGMLATALATPCSGPFLGSTLTWTLTQPVFVVLAVFTSLGLGMALPYVVLTANPALLKLLPRPGAWMDTFKHAMGFVLLLTVLYLMVSLHQDELLYTVAFLVGVGFACWWWGRFAPRAASRLARLRTLAVTLLLLAGSARLAFVEFRGLFETEGRPWESFEPDTFLGALGEQNVFVDFTANWCPNCKVNEGWVYDNAQVRRELEAKGVRMFKADITHRDARTALIGRLMAQLGYRSIPLAALFPAGEAERPHVLPEFVGRSEFLDLIATLPAPDAATEPRSP